MRLTREYYSLRFEEYAFMTEYLTKIKTLEEWIRNTNVVLDDDKQTLLCLGQKHGFGRRETDEYVEDGRKKFRIYIRGGENKDSKQEGLRKFGIGDIGHENIG